MITVFILSNVNFSCFIRQFPLNFKYISLSAYPNVRGRLLLVSLMTSSDNLLDVSDEILLVLPIFITFVHCLRF